jgi:hypothetical protein
MAPRPDAEGGEGARRRVLPDTSKEAAHGHAEDH